MPPRASLTRYLIGGGALLTLAGGLAYLCLHQAPSDNGHRDANSPAPPAHTSAATPAGGNHTATPSSSTPEYELRGFAKKLAAAGTPEEARRLLTEIRSYLAGLPKAQAVSALQAYLSQAADLATKLSFSITPDGSLKEAPTLRVWLLDCLGMIDPQAAADFARNILGSSGSPDEWAVSLRDFARVRTSPADLEFVQGKIREMIGRPDWLKDPSAGFLEAFDAIVYTHDTALTPDLARLVQDTGNRAAAHAAYLTMDRLVIQDPVPMLDQLERQPEILAGREQTRANYFARADVTDPEQRRLVESYLLDPAHTAAELKTFAGLYPSANYMISNNLLTQVATPGHDELASHDRQALAVVDEWLADTRFTALQPQLQQIRTRLAGFVQQAEASAPK